MKRRTEVIVTRPKSKTKSPRAESKSAALVAGGRRRQRIARAEASQETAVPERSPEQGPVAAGNAPPPSARPDPHGATDEQAPLSESSVSAGADLLPDDEPIEAAGEVVQENADIDELAPPSVSLARLDPMQQYLRDIQTHPLLTPEDEHRLAVEYAETGNVAAAARLVTANLRLVVKIAYEYRRAYRSIMDLVQEGNIGLMQAVRRFDPHRGVKLSSYAAWWIRAYILRFVLNNWRLVKLGTTQAQRKLFFNLNKEKARLSAMGIEPSPAEIAHRLGVEEQEVVDMDRRLSAGEMSLDAPLGETDGRPVSRLELMPAATSGPDAQVTEGEMHHLLQEKLASFRTTLTGKDVAIFDERLVAEEPLTLQQLGDKFGVSRERVRQLEARLTGRLREYLQTELGDAVVG